MKQVPKMWFYLGVAALLIIVAGIAFSTAVTLAGGREGRARVMKICVDDTTGGMRVKGSQPCDTGETRRILPKGRRTRQHKW